MTGKFLILIGIIFVIMGIFFTLGGKIPWLGKLPGDILIEKKNATFYFPITTCIIVSIVLSVIFFFSFKK